MIPLLPLALAAAELAPGLIKWIAGENAGDVAGQVVDTVKSVAGMDDPEAAVAAIKASPELQLEFQRAASDLEIRLFESETERLKAVNRTIQEETKSSDRYVRRWRPTFGYAMCLAWVVQVVGSIFGIIWSVIAETAEAGIIISAIGEANAATIPMWGIALTVIGVSVHKRSQDKVVASGQSLPAGILSTIAGKIGGA